MISRTFIQTLLGVAYPSPPILGVVDHVNGLIWRQAANSWLDWRFSYLLESFSTTLNDTVSNFNSWHPSRKCSTGVPISDIRDVLQTELSGVKDPFPGLPNQIKRRIFQNAENQLYLPQHVSSLASPWLACPEVPSTCGWASLFAHKAWRTWCRLVRLRKWD